MARQYHYNHYDADESLAVVEACSYLQVAAVVVVVAAGVVAVFVIGIAAKGLGFRRVHF